MRDNAYDDDAHVQSDPRYLLFTIRFRIFTMSVIKITDKKHGKISGAFNVIGQPQGKYREIISDMCMYCGKNRKRVVE